MAWGSTPYSSTIRTLKGTRQRTEQNPKGEVSPIGPFGHPGDVRPRDPRGSRLLHRQAPSRRLGRFEKSGGRFRIQCVV